MINRTILIGRMTKDPELRRTGQGNAVASFNLAVNRNFKSNDGQQEADFIPCVCWNKLAENIDTYCSKGSLVGVEGSLRSRNYENSQGQKVFVVELLCDSVQFLETKRDKQPVAQSYNQPQQQYQQPQQQQNYGGFAQPTQGEFGNQLNIDPNDIQF